MKLPRGTLEDWIVIVVFILALIWAAFVLSSCASQQRQVKAHYIYTKSCEFIVSGGEVQTGTKVGTGVDVNGDGCIIGRDTSAETEGIKKPPTGGETTDGGNQR